MRKQWKQGQTIFLGSQITADGNYSQEIKRCLLLGRKAMTNLDSMLKSRDITLLTNICLVKAMVFQWSCVDVRVGPWRRLAPKNPCFLTAVLEKILKSLLDRKIKPVNSKGNPSWIFIWGTDTEAIIQAPILWPPDGKSWLIEKDPDAGKDWSQEEKGMTENEMVGWHHWLKRHEFVQVPGDGKV